METIQLYAWHFMAWPFLPKDFDERYESGWVTVPNALFDRDQARGLYQRYIDELAYAAELGFDGVVLNEHHQNIYGLMPAPNLIAAALTQRTERAKIVVLGNLLPLHLRPLRVAEEYAMLDVMSGGRVVAGLATGSGPEFFNYDVSPPIAREQFWEAVDLIRRAWTEDGPFEFAGQHFHLRYVNPWPKPVQQPHPPIWVPGTSSVETMEEVARRGLSYFLSTRGHLSQVRQAAARFAEVVEGQGGAYHPNRAGLLLSVYVAETDEIARRESEEAIWYFLRFCLKGLLRRKGRAMLSLAGAATFRSFEQTIRRTDPTAPALGDAVDWAELDRGGSIIVGSPATVRQKLAEYVQTSRIGHFLIQFQIGNLATELARKNLALFASEVMPHLRREGAELMAREYPGGGQPPRVDGSTAR